MTELITVTTAAELGENLIDALGILERLFATGGTLRVVDGPSAGTHTQTSLALEIALICAEDQRRPNPSPLSGPLSA